MQESQEVIEIRSKFDTFYQSNLKHLFDELEKSRKKYLKAFIVSAVFVFGFLPITIFWQLDNILRFLNSYGLGENVDLFFYVYLMFSAVVAVPISLYKKKNKKIIMPEFIKFFECFSYTDNKAMPREAVDKSKLFDLYNNKSSDDYFEGIYKNINIVISEESLEKEYTNHKGEKRSLNIFNGIFVSFSMNKSFEGQTVAKKDKGFLNRFNGCGGLEGVKLEDVVFEKEWEVYSNCQVEARYLLTTAFMERLLRVKKLYKSSRLQFAFFDNILFLAIDMKGDMFETSSLFKSTFDRKHINETLEQFLSVLAIVDILKLNQKIGM